MASTATKNIMLSQSKIGQPSEYGTPNALTFQATVEDDDMIVKIEVPGVDPTGVGVHCDASILYVECTRGSMSLPIDAALDTGDISADIQWGMLTLRIPRRAARAVKVNIHDSASTRKNPSKPVGEV